MKRQTISGFSGHADRRLAQRSIPEAFARLAVRYGRRIKQAGGRTAWFVGRKLAAKRKLPAGLAGVAVVTARDGTVVTAIRTDNPRRLKRAGRSRAQRLARRRRQHRW